jgi:hypothetical protein
VAKLQKINFPVFFDFGTVLANNSTIKYNLEKQVDYTL